ncbi:MAG: hypothetical protein WC356_05160 [Candidatus Micrarchaeia archaeon]|jgi:hypothetical protein
MKTIYFYKDINAEFTAEKLRERSRMKGFEFIGVKVSDIKKIKGKAILIWGNGNKHQLSYYFDWPDKDEITKINIDQHTDSLLNHCEKGIKCWNHFYFSIIKEKRKGKIILPDYYKDQIYKLPLDYNKLDYLDPNNPIIEGNIQLTIDLDVIDSIPVLPVYLSYEGNGLSNEELYDIIYKLFNNSGELVRFDIGGICKNRNAWKATDLKEDAEIMKRIYSDKGYNKVIDIFEHLILEANEKMEKD